MGAPINPAKYLARALSRAAQWRLLARLHRRNHDDYVLKSTTD
jgi:hypothetical protein